MNHDFGVGDIIRLNGTKTEAEVLELQEDDFRGELLRVKLSGSKGDDPQGTIFVLPQLVELVRSASAEGGHPRPGKKILT